MKQPILVGLSGD